MIGTAGQLLVAEPMLGDPNFDRTVVLVVEHSAEGAMGLVLNRPSAVAVDEALPEWAPLVSAPAVVHIGGPVEERSGWCVARVDEPERPGFVPLLGDVGLLDLGLDPLEVRASVLSARLFAGYSGWGAGQLERELADDAWIVVPAQPDDPFLPDGEALWSRILARQGGSLSRLAHFPPDPSLN